MIPRIFTTPDWLASLMRRYLRYTTNVFLPERCSPRLAGVAIEERVVALVQTTDGREYLFTSHRLAERGRTLVRYDEVVRCHWISNHPDPRERARLKETHYDRLLLETVDGRTILLEHLSQAVFPLLRFFRSITTG